MMIFNGCHLSHSPKSGQTQLQYKIILTKFTNKIELTCRDCEQNCLRKINSFQNFKFVFYENKQTCKSLTKLNIIEQFLLIRLVPSWVMLIQISYSLKNVCNGQFNLHKYIICECILSFYLLLSFLLTELILNWAVSYCIKYCLIKSNKYINYID